MKSIWLKKTYLIGFLFTLLLGCNTKNTPPNIVFILTDDQGYADLSVHGSPDVYTPIMDNLKSQSISLENFQASASCSPTRSAIMTGRHPMKNGISHTILERERMGLGITTLPEILKRANYASGIFGKWHLGDEEEYQPENRGFDEVFIHGGGGIGQNYPGSCADVPGNKYFDPTIKHNGTFVKTTGYCTDIFFAQALSWIKEQSDKEEPFFAYIPTNAAHGPHIAPEKYKTKYIEQGYPKRAQGFYGMIENLDDNLGILMEKLDAWGLADNTILIFMSDNGKSIYGGENNVHGETYNAGMKGFKGDENEGGTRVPFFIRFPKKFQSGKKINVLLNHYDILPTIAEIAHIDITDIPELDGRSFLPLLKGEQVKWEDRYRFVHVGGWPLNPMNVNSQNPGRWLGTVETSNPDSSKYKRCAVRNERFRFVNNNELYDMINDPGQTKNIVSEHPELVAEMREAYNAWWIKTRPFMVNENAPLAKEKPFWIDYKTQLESSGIGAWEMPDLE